MGRIIAELILGVVFVLRRTVGVILTPYATYRRLVESGRLVELVILWLIVFLYLAFSSLIRTQTFHPMLLTREFLLLAGASFGGYVLIVLTFYLGGLICGKKKTLFAIALSWGYSLIPTIFWFFATTVLYVFLPPPRSETFLGQFFSVLFLLFSALLLFWKIELAYLTMRFSLKLGFKNNLFIGSAVLLVAFTYSLLLYKISIFKIPFL